MKRAQMYLDDEEYEALRAEAFKRRASISSVMRQLIQVAIVGKQKKRSVVGLDAIIGMVRDTKTDVAQRHDEYLWGRPNRNDP